ncbi:amidohydrolase [Cupriavidus necator]|uniref:Amidohydrolase n=1 Tax=Cupriavidus necator TaxID=106590 RepID=A0A367PCU7_CUPNE|nr:amidohydrolase [Cupriavidus necator]QQX87273.1 amidohydrolase [Cupriavidus necator]RCJ05702.1 amidohydrolase [Cupriavidus necator]
MKKVIRMSMLALGAGMALSLSAHAAPTLVESVQGYTLKQDKITSFTGLVFDQGKVLATGDATALRAQYPDAKRIDGQGKTLLPGLIDAHGHVFRLGFKTTEISLSGTKTLAEAQGMIRAYGDKNPQRKWLLGYGWNQVNWKLGRFPTAAELDAAVSDRPVRLVRVDGHAAWLNTRALQAAGITRDTKDPAGGRIERDADGNPTGVLVDKAMALVNSVIPPYSDDDRRAALAASLAHMNALGLTAAGDAGVTVAEDKIYREFADQGKLTTRIYGMIRDTGDDFKALSAKGPLVGYGNDRYYLRAVKLYGDGALGSRGAALMAPYSDDHVHSGLLFMSDAAMQAAVKTAIKAGYQVNIHAIGDATNHQVLDAMEAAYKDVGGRQLRNRVEHAQVIALPDIPRFKTLDLIASMQPTHATSDMNMAEDRVGKDRIKGAYAWQTLLKQGTVIAGGSDFPVESANPFYGLHAAVTRTDHEGRPIRGWHPEEAMTLPQAFRAFTLDAAYAEHQEKTLGSLEAGKWADFILVDQDLFKAKPADIWKTQVLETWVAGERVYAKDGKR